MWVTDEALEILLAIRGLQVGDEVLLKIKVRVDIPTLVRVDISTLRQPGEKQDPALFPGGAAIVTRGTSGKRYLAVRHPNYEFYYISLDEVVGWRPKKCE